jgi:hypothetical protein
VKGPFDFVDQLDPRDDFRNIALDTRPDLKAAVESIEKAQSDHKLAVANGRVGPDCGRECAPPLRRAPEFSGYGFPRPDAASGASRPCLPSLGNLGSLLDDRKPPPKRDHRIAVEHAYGWL